MIVLQSKQSRSEIIVSDIESRAGWIHFLCIGYYDGFKFVYFNNLKEYFEMVFNECDGRSIYFHFGGGYDFLFLIDFVFNSDDEYFVVEAIPRGSSFLSIKIQDSRGRSITFLDSSALLPFKLATLAENFNVETKKGSIDYESIQEITLELIDYLRDDCLALHQVLTKYANHPMIARVGLKLTRSGQAFSLFTKHYLEQHIKPLKKKCEDFCRQAYQGGRTEIFKPVFDNGLDFDDNGDLYDVREDAPNFGEILRCYDVNSLYPYVMKDNDYPIEFEGWVDEIDFEKLSIYHVKVYIPAMKIPPLGTTQSGKFMFPIGEVIGHWTNIELKMAVKYGVKILEVYEGAIFKNGGRIFEKYIDEMYSLRKASDKKSADNIIYKDMMNHLYGRFGLDKEKEKIVIDDGSVGLRPYLEIPVKNGKMVRLALEDTHLKSLTFLPIPIFVTSYARVYNYENFIKPFEESIYYTDTDSFFLAENFDQFPESRHGENNELGGLKIEYEGDQACFFLPKTYIFKGNEKIIKMKGFDKRKIQHFQFDDFTNSLEGEIKLNAKTGERIAKFKESLRRNKKVLSVLNESTKRIRSRYDKREIIKINGIFDTKPFYFHN